MHSDRYGLLGATVCAVVSGCDCVRTRTRPLRNRSNVKVKCRFRLELSRVFCSFMNSWTRARTIWSCPRNNCGVFLLRVCLYSYANEIRLVYESRGFRRQGRFLAPLPFSIYITTVN